ncbi:MAG: hypothetical protein CBE00_11160 [Planctomycetaceae bacterium TMED240]|nr:hypothetical protein [Rhodopirellula sp.]OUX05205.1 MAG: hypothetical protein CBE00_11160 [Planctomycetaceae bacterium TMED240]
MSASTISDNAPLDPDDELLVAYLDGELQRQEQSDLENRLLKNEKLRSRLQQLQTGWDLLEDLPGSSPSMKLVESTLELVVADILKDQPVIENNRKQWQLPVVLLVLCSITGLAAYFAQSTLRSNAYQQELEDLALAGNLSAYNYGGDLKLMRQLSADKNWAQMISASKEIGDINVDNAVDQLTEAPAAEREVALKAMTLEQMDQLNSRWDQFNRLNQSAQSRIRQTAASIAAQPDAELLLETMQVYAIWRQTLPTELRDQIESSDPAKRRAAIKQAIDRTYFTISRRSSMRLDDETTDWINFSLGVILQERLDKGDAVTKAYYDDLRSLTNVFRTAEDAKQATIATMVIGASRSKSPTITEQSKTESPKRPTAGDSKRTLPSSQFFSRLERPSPLSREELDTIKLPLPDSALEMLGVVSMGNPLTELVTLRVWCEEALRRKYMQRFEDNLSLEERYNKLPSERRNRIDLLSPENFLREMSRPSRTPR